VISALLAAHTGHDRSERFAVLVDELGAPHYKRINVPATPEQTVESFHDSAHLDAIVGEAQRIVATVIAES
jgi:hypothetical protein